MTNASKTIQDLFDLQVEDLKGHIDNLSIFDDAEEYKDGLALIAEKLDQLESLMVMRQSLGIEESTYLNIREEAGTVGELDLESLETATLQKIFYFERKLRGGVIHLDDGDYYIAEKMVRDMGIVHGAKVSIINDYVHNGKRRYSFHIHENGVTDRPGRVQRDRVRVVEQDGQRFVYLCRITSRYYDLSQDDVDKYQLEHDDVIDVAYYENNPLSHNVIYKHLYKTPELRHYNHVLVAVDEYGYEDEDIRKRLHQHGVSTKEITLCYGTEMLFTLSKYASQLDAFVFDPSLREKFLGTRELFIDSKKDIHQLNYLEVSHT